MATKRIVADTIPGRAATREGRPPKQQAAQTSYGGGPSSGLSQADLANMTRFALTRSTFVSMMYSGSQNQQALTDQLNLYAERQKAAQGREETLRDLRDAISKIDSEVHKNRARTAADLSRGMSRVLTRD